MYKIITYLLLFAIISSCSNKNTQNTANTPQIPVIVIKTMDTVFNDNIVADIQAIKNVEIRARVRGYLESILVDEGKEVRKGQPLFKLSSPEYTAEYTKAEATLERALAEEKATNLEVERVKMLVEKNVIAQSELMLAESKAQVSRAVVLEARSILKNAQAFLDYTTILAPFDGVINRIPLKMGSLINEGDLLTSISDISSIYAYFYLSETEYLRYLQAKREGDSIPDEKNVHLLLADGSTFKHKGKVETAASEIDGATGAIAFRARFTNPEKFVKHGASGTIKLITDIENVIMIPQKTVMEIQDKNYVFLVDSLNKINMQSITIGKRMGMFYLVQSGLKPKDKIVLEGVQLLRQGDIINPVVTNY